MKKHFGQFILAAGLALLLCACEETKQIKTPSVSVPGAQSSSGEVNPGKTQAGTSDNQETGFNKENPVVDRWSENGSFETKREDGSIEVVSYEFCLPLIQADTPDALAINQEIADKYEAAYEIIQKGKESKEIAYSEIAELDKLFYTKYDCYVNDEVVSIIINSTYGGEYDIGECTVYNFDLSSGKELQGKDLVARQNVNMEDFVEDIRRAAAYEADRGIALFYDTYMPIDEYGVIVVYGNGSSGGELKLQNPPQGFDEMYSLLLENRAKLISVDNINEEMQVALDENGELKAYVTLTDMRQAYEYTIALSPVPRADTGLHVELEQGVIVDVNEEGVFISFLDQPEGWLEDKAVKSGQKYKIEGAYKNYVDVKHAAGNGLMGIFLLCDDGTLSCIEYYEGELMGGFCIVDAVPGLTDIQSMKTEGFVLICTNGSGQRITPESSMFMLMGLSREIGNNMLKLNEGEGYAAEKITKGAGEEGVQTKVFIGKDGLFGSACISEPIEQSAGGGYAEIDDEKYHGLSFSGMNEKGIIYRYNFTKEINNQLHGMVAIRTYSEDFEVGEEKRAVYTHLGGFDVLDSEGEEIVFYGMGN